ncbi:hypothetical protein M5K25_020802 [Dendrobium thyrsiflorum]|uniref:Protein kinase domain-containing protein n=1 Tax=Dendrobium thyrsiflorum TaxID=117978 RepID=A0ABD0UAZ3_DENTH
MDLILSRSSMEKLCIFFHLMIALLPFSFFPISKSRAVETQALLQFKSNLEDPLNYLENWKASQSPCTFSGVICDFNSVEVFGISLANKSLSGEISPSIFSLRSLKSLDMGSNSISGTVPSELVNCTSLQLLNLSYNSLSSQLPDLSPLKNLQILDLSSNYFSGRFPEWVGNLSKLVHLGLALNNFDEGKIPPNIGNLKNLTYLFLARCNFTGGIPPSVFELRELGTLDFSMNKLSGEFPKEITNMISLYKIELYQNNLTGEIPPEIAKLTNLQEIDISQNKISGKLPTEMGNLKNLTVIQLFHNNLWGEIPKGFGDLQFLKAFSVYMNEFSGEIPESLGRFSPLNSFDISENNFSGQFPRFLCENNNLQYLLALDNNFSGEFPDSYSTCKTLIRFRISQNNLNGTISDGLWGLPNAVIIDFADNNFMGLIPSVIGTSSSLTQLYVQNNKFSGQIPIEIGKLSQLQKFYAFNNFFSGFIPSQIGKLKQLTSLHLENNKLTGPIPYELSTCTELVEIDLAQNSLGGVIPEPLSSLTSLNSLNLSQNLITGLIPEGLQALKLSSIDFSKNRLSGEVPPGLLMIAGNKAFYDNPDLCIDGSLESQWREGLGICNFSGRHGYILGKKTFLVAIILSILFILLTGLVVVSYRSFKQEEASRRKDLEKFIENDGKWKLESFHPTDLEVEEICNLEEVNLLGSGGTGKVYRLDLKNKGTVAVKQLWKNDGAKVSLAEIDILGKIRHRNILKLYASLSKDGLNFLVFEYMKNGNLYCALRREIKVGQPELDWNKRYKIAVGAAKGIMYLHHDCSPAIIHRDIKSTNILLDEEYEAKIADFGIAKVIEDSDLSCFAGTHGYMAPELAYSLKVTEKSDVYSFGVVLLELLTGHSPIEPQYGEGKDIVYWVSCHLNSSKICEILDPRISKIAEEDMMKVLKVAILCTAKLPSLRPTMREVVNMLIDAGSNDTREKVKNYGKKS